MNAASFSRRRFLERTACGFGALAFSALASGRAAGAASAAASSIGMQHAPRAKRVIFLFMQGGVSQVDSFDHKPRLATDDGKKMPFDDARLRANTGSGESAHRVMKSPWQFAQHGACGRWVSELFPETARHVDDLCVLHGLHTEGVAHGPATLFLHCGATSFVRPSMGSWVLYGLGTENDNLPGFVTISPSSGNGGARNYGTAFLPAQFQGTALGRAGMPAAEARLRNLAPADDSSPLARGQLDRLQALNQAQLQRNPGDDELEAAMRSYELAWRMQAHAPEVLDLSGESAATFAQYGIGQPATDNFGRQCLLARRLCEAGVRYVQVTYGDNTANPAWDQHSNLPKHAEHARAVDLPIAGLLADLKQHALLEDTIVWWGGEFGRTPYAQNNGTGRDHNPEGFTVWLAGGGFQPGIAYGATDEFGHRAIAGKMHMHDLHATILHQLGLDHERLTYRYAGRDFRLTDVFGHVVHEVLET
ncbi:MAG: DUF1501 domain-containing protein [Pirellulales bacterium]|nr:DUF1501 domain-containing protein [Pirellulales bacterium]